jgi:hypothetical protein
MKDQVDSYVSEDHTSDLMDLMDTAMEDEMEIPGISCDFCDKTFSVSD